MIKRISIFALGLASVVIPARASLTYQSSASTFDNQVTVTDGLTLGTAITFTSADLKTTGTVTDDEYLDTTDGIEFIAFNSSGTANEAFTVSGGTLHTASGSGDAIEIIFTNPSIDGLGVTFTTTWSNGDNLCEGTTNGSCAGNVYVSENGSGFMGALNDSPLPATSLPTLWLHTDTGSADTDLESFVLAEPQAAPEVRTMLMMGFGLVAIGLLHRRRRPCRG